VCEAALPRISIKGSFTLPTGLLGAAKVGCASPSRVDGWEVVIGGSASQKIGFWGATPVVQPSSAAQAAVTLGNSDGEIGGLTISDPPTPAEVQALRDKCEELADDVRAFSALVHELRTALVGTGFIKAGA
jgi:hypothetical protein